MPELPCTVKAWKNGAEVLVTVPGVEIGVDVISSDLTVWDADAVIPPGDPNLPLAPTNLVATSITGTSFVLTWDGSVTPATFPITEYDIYKDGALIDTVTDSAAVVVDPIKDAIGSQLAELVDGLTASTIYRFTIAALNDAGQSELSTELIVQTAAAPVADVPNAPASLNAPSISDTQVTLSWPAATLSGSATAVQGYRIYAAGSTLMKSVSATTLTTVVGGLFPTTTYDFTVRAFNTAGESQPSPIRTVTTLASTSNAPTQPYGDTTSVVTAINAAGTIAAVATALAPISTYYAFTFSFKTAGSVTSTGPGWTALTSGDLALAKSMAKYYAEEFAKYPKDFVVDAALNQVVLAKTITFDGVTSTGPYAYQQSIYEFLPSDATTNPDNWRRVIHHEFWHVVDGGFPSIMSGQEAQWRAANGSGYLYVSEGGTLRSVLADGHPLNFIDATAEQSYAEDRAQVHSALMAQPRYSQLLVWMSNDPGLTTKVNLIKAECGQIDLFMSGSYWDNINPPPVSTIVPNAPTGLAFSNVADNSVTLSWNASTVPSGGPAVQGYRVIDANTQAILKSVGVVTTTSVTGLIADTSYSVYLRAFNADGQSSTSTTVTFTTTGGVTPPPGGQIFTSSAIWNKPLPANAPVLTNSAQLLQTLANDNPSPWYKVSMDAYGMPTYYTKATDPVFHVQISKGCPPVFGPNGPGIKMPAGRHGNAEGAMTIIDRTSWTNNGQQGGLWVAAMHQLGAANWTGSTYQADGGAVFYIASNGLDGRLAQSTDNRNTGSLRGCPNNVRRSFAKEDYAAGIIPHAIEGFINNTGNTFVFPWVGTESGSLPGWPEGTQMRLKSTVNLNAVGPTGSAAWILAKCCQTYGVFAGDQAGKTAQLKAENTSLQNGGGSDWAGTNLTTDCLKPFPFNSTFWEVIQYGYTR